MSRNGLWLQILIVGFAYMSVSAHAGTLFYKYELSMTTEANSNIRLRQDDKEDVLGIKAAASGRLSRQTETSDWYLQGTLSSSNYDTDETLDSDDQTIRAGVQQNRERWSYGLNSEWLRQSSLLTEIEDSGLFTDVERRVQISASPNFQYSLSDANLIFVDGTYQTVEYPNTIPVSLSEYDYWTSRAGFRHLLSETDQISISVFYSDYDASDIDSSTQTVGANVSYTKLLSPYWRTETSFGFRRSKLERDVAGDTDTDHESGGLFDFSLTRSGETQDFTVSASRSLNPSSIGVLNQTDTLGLVYVQRWSERLSSSVSSSWSSRETVGSEQSTDDRDLVRASARMNYRVSKHWSLSGEYRFIEQKFDTNSNRAESHAALISLRYGGQNTPM